MPDYVGALAAIKSRLLENWTATPVGFINETSPETTDENSNPAPWVLAEIVSSGSTGPSMGTPGNQIYIYEGLIKLHVFVPAGSGIETGFTHAVALGEIFRNKLFYDETPGYYVRTWTPRIDEGDASSDDGLWFGVTATINFEYWHRA